MNYNNNYFFYKCGKIIINFLPFWLVFNVFWFGDKFDNPSIDQILFHLQFGMAEADFDKTLIVNYLIRGLFYPGLLTVLFLNLRTFLLKAYKSNVSILWLMRLLPWMLVIFGLTVAIQRFKVVEFFSEEGSGEDIVAKHYVDPRNINLTVKKPKNIIIIYVESLENSYKSREVFRRNLIAPIEGLLGAEVPNYVQMPGTGWTMGVLFLRNVAFL